MSLLMKKYLLERNFAGIGKKEKRLSVQEMCAVDAKRRLVIVKRDGVEHLLLLGVNSELLIESDIRPLLKKEEINE